MAQGKFSKDNPINDIIVLEGQFVSSFLSDIPPVFLKVYIYLNYLCYHHEIKADTLTEIANQTNVSVSDLYYKMGNTLPICINPFNLNEIYQGIIIEGMLSRKKQIIPYIMNVLEKL